MNNIAYDDTQIDSLQEVVNISMGQAGASLAKLFDTFIRLSIPNIHILNAQNILKKFEQLASPNQDRKAVRQAFYNGVRGEAIVVFHDTNFAHLAELVGLHDLEENEVMFDVSNILVGATLCGIAEQLGLEVGFNPPSLLNLNSDSIQYSKQMDWERALSIEISFQFESKNFLCNLLLLMSEDSLQTLKKKIDIILEKL